MAVGFHTSTVGIARTVSGVAGECTSYVILFTCKTAPCLSTCSMSQTAPQPFQVLLFLPYSHLVSSPAALIFAREKLVITAITFFVFFEHFFIFMCIRQAHCPPWGKGLHMIKREDVQWTITELQALGHQNLVSARKLSCLGFYLQYESICNSTRVGFGHFVEAPMNGLPSAS